MMKNLMTDMNSSNNKNLNEINQFSNEEQRLMENLMI